MKVPQEPFPPGPTTGIRGVIYQYRKRILYATGLFACEPWERQIACSVAVGVILVLSISFFLSLFIFIPSEMIVFFNFFINKALNYTRCPTNCS
nr:hypothetical transcript [Hymenolepis microstoma]